MQLIIGGDLVPTQSNIKLFNEADIKELLGESLVSLLNESDIRIFNLEVPITDKEDPILKNGLNLIAPTSAMKGIKALSPSLIILANNHILDQGIQGLKSTEEMLKKNEIPFVGIGNNIFEASRPYIFQKTGLSIGIYACAEHEFSIATNLTPGANPFDPFESFDHIYALKEKCDYVIVLYHGGKEHYRYPSPYLQKVCRKMAQKGADLVVCQHSHCIGCYEEFENSTIVYGQGNFLFDHSVNEFWMTSLLIKININGGIHINYVPIVKKGNGVCVAEGQVAENILTSFRQRSFEILHKGFIEKEYLQFAKENIQSYLRRFSGFNKWLSWIDLRLLGGRLLKMKYDSKQLQAIKNYIICEAHRELVVAGLSFEETSPENE
ncbi:hypothetical protein UNSWDHB_528 [Dehalobacter sp. UNSWDHB]|uniref:CapA family protein n=1 Tax=Dehalobacter sp. UNSWDHB TaxID=1339256 RepID=UPI0003875744|nr:CapA family protein [Dehalobacter sp. UNSWDHB]EQB22830.1 hypothetical protein UNSWDHB_528 [Dehalobacter sp. UNSWDHB]